MSNFMTAEQSKSKSRSIVPWWNEFLVAINTPSCSGEQFGVIANDHHFLPQNRTDFAYVFDS